MLNISEVNKHEEYKQLCIASYKPFDQKLSNSYSLLMPVKGKQGFYGCAYMKGNDVVMVYRFPTSSRRNLRSAV